MKIFTLVALISTAALIGMYHYQTHINDKIQDEPFNQDLAETLTSFAISSYCDTDTVKTWTCGETCNNHPEMTEIEIFKNDQMQTFGYLAYNTYLDAIIVVFRGTENWSNAKEDMSTMYDLVSYSLCTGCQVHSGFYKAYKSISSQFKLALKNKQSLHTKSKIIVTGHSLGGAMATLASAYLIHNQIEFTLYTLGSPRVGNREFVHWFNKNRQGVHYRITNNKDPVPHMPMIKMGFKHIPQEVFYYQQPEIGFEVCQYKSEDKTCADRFFPSQWYVPDHLTYLGYNMGSHISQCMNQTQKQIMNDYIKNIDNKINYIKNQTNN